MATCILNSCVLFILGMLPVQGAKILMIPPEHHSNANCFAVAGRALFEAGHEVHFLTIPRHKALVDDNKIKGIYFQPKEYTNPTENAVFMESVMTPIGFLGRIAQWNTLISASADLCHQMLDNVPLNALIADGGYDVALVESNDIVRCLMVIPYRHRIPYITLGIRHDPWSARVPASPSAEGHFGLHPFADPYNPTVWERWMAVLTEMVFYYILPPTQMSDDFVTKYAQNRPALTMREIYQNAELHFINMEISCLDTPRVSTPHYVTLGGIGTEPAKPLRDEIEAIANNATYGLVVVSFGSAIKNISLPRMEVMLTAFRQVPQQVVMRYDGPLPENIPSNVMLSKWIPQNDLLGHPKTRLFISHSGGNGQMEALYHGVPFVSIPVMDEQTYNAKRAVARGAGTMLNLFTFTADDLLVSMTTIMNNPNYIRKMKGCAARYRYLPNPQKTLTFWVDHVIKHGGDHLKPASLNMPLWQWFNFDILFICSTLLHVCLRAVLSMLFS